MAIPKEKTLPTVHIESNPRVTKVYIWERDKRDSKH